MWQKRDWTFKAAAWSFDLTCPRHHPVLSSPEAVPAARAPPMFTLWRGKMFSQSKTGEQYGGQNPKPKKEIG